MPWRRVEPMDQRVRFVIEVSNKQLSMAELCRHFEISRRTGYKWLARYQAEGIEGMRERSRRPLSSPNHTSVVWEHRVAAWRQKRPRWGPKKLAEMLRREFPRSKRPAISTIGVILKRYGLVMPRRCRHASQRPQRGPLTLPTYSNHVWAVDFKGWFRTGDQRRCDPLTVTDLFSRYVLTVDALADQSQAPVQRIFRRLFATYGLPAKIRCDNGAPFASTGAAGFSQLSVWWMLQGIEVELIDRGCPQQNGSHERMHLTLKQETTKPAAANHGAQQRRFGIWRRDFNEQRPHEALEMKMPAEVYRRGRPTSKPILRQPKYPRDWMERRVRRSGQIKWQGKLRFLGHAFAGVTVGIVNIEAGRHRVHFGSALLGELHDLDERGVRPAAIIVAPNRNQ
jgi:transposase InsO family protein